MRAGSQMQSHPARSSAHPKKSGLEQPTHTPEPGLTSPPPQTTNHKVAHVIHMRRNPGTPGATAASPLQGSQRGGAPQTTQQQPTSIQSTRDSKPYKPESVQRASRQHNTRAATKASRKLMNHRPKAYSQSETTSRTNRSLSSKSPDQRNTSRTKPVTTETRDGPPEEANPPGTSASAVCARKAANQHRTEARHTDGKHAFTAGAYHRHTRRKA